MLLCSVLLLSMKILEPGFPCSVMQLSMYTLCASLSPQLNWG